MRFLLNLLDLVRRLTIIHKFVFLKFNDWRLAELLERIICPYFGHGTGPSAGKCFLSSQSLGTATHPAARSALAGQSQRLEVLDLILNFVVFLFHLRGVEGRQLLILSFCLNIDNLGGSFTFAHLFGFLDARFEHAQIFNEEAPVAILVVNDFCEL